MAWHGIEQMSSARAQPRSDMHRTAGALLGIAGRGYMDIVISFFLGILLGGAVGFFTAALKAAERGDD
jgi:hypothetical protein